MAIQTHISENEGEIQLMKVLNFSFEFLFEAIFRSCFRMTDIWMFTKNVDLFLIAVFLVIHVS